MQKLKGLLIFLTTIGIVENILDCGTLKVKRESVLSEDSELSYPGQWPWFVAVFSVNITESKKEFLCGASIINDRTLVSGIINFISYL